MIQVAISKTANVGKETKNLNVIGCLGNIISSVRTMAKKNTKDDTDELTVEDILKSTQKDIDYVGEMMSLSQVQVIIMAACIERCSRHRQDLSDISETLHVNYLKLLEFNDDINDLKKRGFIILDKEESIKLPREVLDAFKRNEPFTPQKMSGLTTSGIIRRINDLFQRLEQNTIEDNDLLEEAKALLEQNPETSFSKTINGLKLEEYLAEDLQLFLYLACKFYLDDDDEITRSQVESAFSEEFTSDWVINRIHGGTLDTMDQGIIEFVNEDGLKDKKYIHISDDVKESLFSDTMSVSHRNDIAVDVIAHGSIVYREMFYNNEEKRQIEVLRNMLSPERYNNICESLKSKGLRTGFSCIFYGSPGTGKTETVKQLAKESERDLMMVDVSQLKSCWVGESEKNMKRLFDRYQKLVKTSRNTPILLFNEADAIFGIRKEGAESAVDKMENSIQNIILQQMEDNPGIIIATTNLTENFDRAFERRFLYKVHFEKPSVEAKSKIWKSMIPDLTEDQIHSLACSFDFSGGQIENISRKKLIQSVIDGVEPSYEDLRMYCSEENIVTDSKHVRVGF